MTLSHAFQILESEADQILRDRIGNVHLRKKLEDAVAPLKVVYSDKPLLGTVNHSLKEYVKGIISTNGIESVWAVLKRSIIGTYHHISIKHLHRYVNETAFRLNEGDVKNKLMDRVRSLCCKMVGVVLPYRVLVGY